MHSDVSARRQERRKEPGMTHSTAATRSQILHAKAFDATSRRRCHAASDVPQGTAAPHRQVKNRKREAEERESDHQVPERNDEESY